AQRHRIADPHVGAGTRDYGVTLRESPGMQDVALLAVGIHQQGDARGAVRIVFDLGHTGRNPELVALEIDSPVLLLVAATAVADGDMALVVAAAAALLRLQQALLGSRAGDFLEARHRLEPGGRRHGTELSNCHVSPRTRRSSRRPS